MANENDQPQSQLWLAVGELRGRVSTIESDMGEVKSDVKALRADNAGIQQHLTRQDGETAALKVLLEQQVQERRDAAEYERRRLEQEHENHRQMRHSIGTALVGTLSAVIIGLLLSGIGGNAGWTHYAQLGAVAFGLLLTLLFFFRK